MLKWTHGTGDSTSPQANWLAWVFTGKKFTQCQYKRKHTPIY